MRRAPLPPHLATGSFSLRASDKAGVTRTRTSAQDLVTVSRGIRVPAGSAAAGPAALRAYTDLDDGSILSLGSAARLRCAPLPGWLEEDWRIHLARRRGQSTPRRVNVVGHQLALLPDEVVELDGVRLTSPARTWLDLASVLGVDDLVVAGDSLVCEHGPEFPFPRDALCCIEDLRSMVARHPGSRGVRKARPQGPMRRRAPAGWRSASPGWTWQAGTREAVACGRRGRKGRCVGAHRLAGGPPLPAGPGRRAPGGSPQGAQRTREPRLARELTLHGSVGDQHCREVRTRRGRRVLQPE
ncbi:hypothetical protein [Arthrobacter sp. EPSL27]|uniref:hypothetical protein n=1 Tax=Arthrobacter sp. EPSL27 TaxID=1745378 RepID=UPI0018D23DAD|nr:hypothetical protein [Arthrobacter sp. EPSL27]